jgi:putative transcriptional regulator
MSVKFVLYRVMADRDILKIGEVVERSGIARSTISRIYNNKARRCDLETINKLCNALGCQPGDLFHYEAD